MDTTVASPRPLPVRAAGRLPAQHKPPVLASASGQGFRVLQTRSSPAQLSLFLRPGPR